MRKDRREQVQERIVALTDQGMPCNTAALVVIAQALDEIAHQLKNQRRGIGPMDERLHP
jgi:hypothetical protein